MPEGRHLARCRGAGGNYPALKFHGGLEMAELGEENLDALGRGLENLGKHLENLRERFQLPCVVAVNRFAADTQAEDPRRLWSIVRKRALKPFFRSAGRREERAPLDLARAVVELCETGDGVPPLYLSR